METDDKNISRNGAITLLRRQFKELNEGGIPVFFRKIRTLLTAFFAISAALPVVLVIRVMRPFLLIRFGVLPSGRIGHYAAATEVYLCERAAGMHGGKRVIDAFYNGTEICNHQLKRMWDRTIPVFQFVKWLDRVNRFLPGGGEHIVPFRRQHDRDIYGVLVKTEPRLSFTEAEECSGKDSLNRLGVLPEDSFVCFHARDKAYLESIRPGWDWGYHDYRDSDIDDYIPAARELVKRGYFAIRVGAKVKKEINVDDPGIIDYAAGERTDFMDIYLNAKCRFFIGDTAGICDIPVIFRRPVALVNFIPIEGVPAWHPDYLFIPKKLWLRNEKRFLTFKEIIGSGIGEFLESRQYERAGIEVVNNTPEEIADLAVEMEERINGTWQTTEEDEEMQSYFWSFFRPSEWNGTFVSRIGTKFLRSNKDLLRGKGNRNVDVHI